MGRVIDLLDAQPELPRVRPIFITVDPYRDTVEQMDAYAKDFHPRTEDDDDYVVDHSIVMYLMDRQGEFLKFYPQMSEAPEIAESIAEQMREQLGLAKGGSFLSRLFS
ncbi:sco2 [Symbiodinium sp. KB8]|nr:sco2 [Symbiodinium sp. KB8]